MSFNPDDENSQFDAFHLDAIADADPYPYWYDDADEPDSNPTLVRSEICDLCVVGGGYNGLWTAIKAQVDASLEGTRRPLASHLARQCRNIQRLQLDLNLIARQ